MGGNNTKWQENNTKWGIKNTKCGEIIQNGGKKTTKWGPKLKDFKKPRATCITKQTSCENN